MSLISKMRCPAIKLKAPDFVVVASAVLYTRKLFCIDVWKQTNKRTLYRDVGVKTGNQLIIK